MMYQVEIHDHGMFVEGQCSADDFSLLAKLANNHGFNLLDAGVAQALGASFVFTNEAGSKEMKKEIDARNITLDRENSWLRGYDTGISSKAIFGVMTEKNLPEIHRHENHPHDPSDFGRCFRLLNHFPEWRDRIGEMAVLSPAWDAFSKHWFELEALYKEESLKESAPKLYGRMKELINGSKKEVST